MVTEAVKPMAGDVAGNDNGAVTDSRSLVDSLVASGALDPLLYCFNVCWAGSAVFFTAKKNQ